MDWWSSSRCSRRPPQRSQTDATLGGPSGDGEVARRISAQGAAAPAQAAENFIDGVSESRTALDRNRLLHQILERRLAEEARGRREREPPDPAGGAAFAHHSQAASEPVRRWRMDSARPSLPGMGRMTAAAGPARSQHVSGASQTWSAEWCGGLVCVAVAMALQEHESGGFLCLLQHCGYPAAPPEPLSRSGGLHVLFLRWGYVMVAFNHRPALLHDGIRITWSWTGSTRAPSTIGAVPAPALPGGGEWGAPRARADGEQ